MSNKHVPFANKRAGTPVTVLLHVVASLVMLGLDYFEVLDISPWIIALPIILLYARSVLYGLLLNSTYEAFMTADADMVARAEEETEEEATILDGASFLQATRS